MPIKTCPKCEDGKLKVIDSRAAADGAACRRRYECTCGARFTTYEFLMRDEEMNHSEASSVGKRLGRIAAQRLLDVALEK